MNRQEYEAGLRARATPPPFYNGRRELRAIPACEDCRRLFSGGMDGARDGFALSRAAACNDCADALLDWDGDDPAPRPDRRPPPTRPPSSGTTWTP